MRNLTKRALLAGFLCALSLCAAAQVQADPIVFNVANPVQTVTAGSSVTFAVSITNPNNLTFELQRGMNAFGPGGLLAQVDGIPLIPPTSPFPGIFPNLATISGDYLELPISVNATPGTYFANLQLIALLQGGGIQVQQALVQVTILPPGEVPEPTSILLLSTGLLGSAGAFRWRRKRRE
ncbi:MAG TPA: PEP-CTERM sorting domain-containing protein [Pyrinomonadaceae bacterium]|nr:PEP-CTERM sorting domain-containing protein [Pyrinomonadaceae bacterium]